MTPEADPDGGPAELWAPPAVEGWRTGTAIDEFTALYLLLARPTRERPGGLHPGQVDDLEVAVVAALLGVGGIDSVHTEGQRALSGRMRHAAEVDKRIDAMQATGTYTVAELRQARENMMAEFTWDGTTEAVGS